MTKLFRFWVVALSICILAPGLAFGSGFAITDQGTRAVAMGGAFAAQADDPSAVYFNPAGITQLEGTQMSAGLAIIKPYAKFESNGTSAFYNGKSTDAKELTFFIPSAYATHQLKDGWSLGFGTFSNYGLTTEWNDDWEGRFIVGSTKSEIITLTANPVVAYRPSDKFAFAVGADLQYMSMELRQNMLNVLGATALAPVYGLPTSQAIPETKTKLSGDSWAAGWNVGVLVWLTDEIKFGMSYRSQVKHSITDGEFEMRDQGVNGYNDTKLEADVTLPPVGYIGLAWSPGPLTLEIDFHWTGWSTYDELAATFDEPQGLPGVNEEPGLTKSKNWDDVWAVRFGGSYQLTESVALLGGVSWDESPIPDETVDPGLPSGDRWEFSLGASYKRGPMTFDFAYCYLIDDGKKFDNEVGNYGKDLKNPAFGWVTGEFTDVTAHIIMLSGSYAF